MFTEGIKQPYPAFNPYTKARYPGGEIVRQGGPKRGYGDKWKLGGNQI
jgi:hypothetical protein